jgi:3-oxoacyl-[acyl-carrier protein] reductase
MTTFVSGSDRVRRALVTGGSRGIGAAIVRSLADRGIDVAFTYRTGVAEAEKLVLDCADSLGSAAAFRYDLLADDPAALLHSVAPDGLLDSLILNAGTWAGGRLAQIDQAIWWAVIEANLRGGGRLAAAAVPALAAAGTGSITFVSSAVGLVGFPGDTAYAAAKSGMIGLARSLAKEVGRAGTRVNVLAPGFVDTDMTAAIPEPNRRSIVDSLVLRRAGSAEEIARAAVFLAEDATYCTGTVLTVDGGWTL